MNILNQKAIEKMKTAKLKYNKALLLEWAQTNRLKLDNISLINRKELKKLPSLKYKISKQNNQQNIQNNQQIYSSQSMDSTPTFKNQLIETEKESTARFGFQVDKYDSQQTKLQDQDRKYIGFQSPSNDLSRKSQVKQKITFGKLHNKVEQFGKNALKQYEIKTSIKKNIAQYEYNLKSQGNDKKIKKISQNNQLLNCRPKNQLGKYQSVFKPVYFQENRLKPNYKNNLATIVKNDQNPEIKNKNLSNRSLPPLPVMMKHPLI